MTHVDTPLSVFAETPGGYPCGCERDDSDRGGR